jgi:hypothetical protein
MTKGQLVQLLIRIIDVALSWAMARLAGKSLVLSLGQLLDVVGVALVTSLFPGKNGLATGQFGKCLGSIPS